MESDVPSWAPGRPSGSFMCSPTIQPQNFCLTCKCRPKDKYLGDKCEHCYSKSLTSEHHDIKEVLIKVTNEKERAQRKIKTDGLQQNNIFNEIRDLEAALYQRVARKMEVLRTRARKITQGDEKDNSHVAKHLQTHIQNAKNLCRSASKVLDQPHINMFDIEHVKAEGDTIVKSIRNALQCEAKSTKLVLHHDIVMDAHVDLECGKLSQEDVSKLQDQARQCVVTKDMDGLELLGERYLPEIISLLRSHKDIPVSLIQLYWLTCATLIKCCSTNKRLFSDLGGVPCAFSSIQRNLHKDGIIAAVLGTLQSVAMTTHELLLEAAYISRLMELVRSPKQRVSFWACLVLGNLLFLTPTPSWPLGQGLGVQEINTRMSQAVENWDVYVNMWVNDKTFQREKEWLASKHPGLQHFAAWSLEYYYHRFEESCQEMIFRDIGDTYLTELITGLLPKFIDGHPIRSLLHNILDRTRGIQPNKLT